MKPCISEVTTLPCTFAQDIANYADAGWTAMEVWLTKLETHLETHSAADTRKLLEDRQITLAAASYQGGLLLSQGEQRKAHYDHFLKRLDLCQQFSIGTLLVVADFVQNVDQTALEARGDLIAAGGAVGGRLRRAPRPGIPRLRRLAQLGHRLGPGRPVRRGKRRHQPGFLSLLHRPEQVRGSRPVDAQRLAFVQVCDLAGVARELASDADRILPGDGGFRLGPLMKRLRDIGYDGWVSLELMNPMLWKVEPGQVAAIGLAALQRLLFTDTAC